MPHQLIISVDNNPAASQESLNISFAHGSSTLNNI